MFIRRAYSLSFISLAFAYLAGVRARGGIPRHPDGGTFIWFLRHPILAVALLFGGGTVPVQALSRVPVVNLLALFA